MIMRLMKAAALVWAAKKFADYREKKNTRSVAARKAAATRRANA
jgi:hypothetical protein